ncbi:hypothetical protein [Sulfuriroseicoccus oceanibius]|uniref:Uncharacterized protein n=1 Tax=Sulfuriroseicoccus oceanibius TaxID=2707525 RepID=A0A6B3L4F0_9BACT|nr:hypothetical protein [Sulfuriroseicoccus oceanibius]QQL45259.1 hypothetical protein G3M56_001330 [Sulfuriroseicoccus oceanibius]
MPQPPNSSRSSSISSYRARWWQTLACACGLVTLASADTISVNFTPRLNDESQMKPQDEAGAPKFRAAHWNNVLVNGSSGQQSNLMFADGSPTSVNVRYTTDAAGATLPIPVTSSDDRMWKGYIDISRKATIRFTNLPFEGEFQVVVYLDGDNSSDWFTSRVTVGGQEANLEDSENTNWGQGDNKARVYQLPVPGYGGNRPWPRAAGEGNNNEGNYVVFSNLKGNAFNLDVYAQGRAAVNGVQILAGSPAATEGGGSEVEWNGGTLVLRRTNG